MFQLFVKRRRFRRFAFTFGWNHGGWGKVVGQSGDRELARSCLRKKKNEHTHWSTITHATLGLEAEE